MSRLFGLTLRDAPESEVESQRLLLRAGYVRQLSSGIFSYLPLGQRSMRKIADILRLEMDGIGGQEVSLPVVHPADIWRRTGRWDTVDATLVRFKDRRGRDMALGMTHEEVVATLAASEVRSYRQLPMLVYQIQTKFRDEPRSRGGLIRTREFLMKDSYSLDLDPAGLQVQYEAHYDAYFRIGARVDLRLVAVESDVGMMGGRVAHEFMYLTPIGEDTLVLCASCGYAANLEVARFRKPIPAAGAPGPLTSVATPGARTVDEVSASVGVDPEQIGKSIFLMARLPGSAEERLVVAVLRGDMDLNTVALTHLIGATDVRAASDEEIRAAGIEPGYGSPVGIAAGQALVVADELVTKSTNLVMGANRPGEHLRNAVYGRDYRADAVGAIAVAFEGAACARCGSPLSFARGVEIGNIFQLGTRYSEPMEARYVDENGGSQPIVMGSYGIGVGRLLASLAEEHRDERGLCLPITVAPFEVSIVAVGKDESVVSTADRLYDELTSRGYDVLYDDRATSAGVKFADADLIGCPLRITVSERQLREESVELKERKSGAVEQVLLGALPAVLHERLQALRQSIEEGIAQVPTWERSQRGAT